MHQFPSRSPATSSSAPLRGGRWRVGALLLAGAGALAAVAAAQQSIDTGAPVHRITSRAGGASPLRRGTGPEAPGGLGSDPYAYHVGGSLLCADCHSAHFSQEHGYDGSEPVSETGAPGGNWLGDTGPNAYLLKAPSSTELCLACHADKSFAPDVVGPDTNALAMRAGGHFADLDVLNPRGHNLSTDPDAGLSRWPLCGRCHFGGDFLTATVQCVDCHNPHGNESHRNLWWASAPGDEPPLVAYIRPGNLGLARYEADNVAYAAPPAGVGGWREVTNACIDCHHNLFSPDFTEDTSPFLRHPGVNSEWGGDYPIDRTGANTDPDFWVNGGASFLVPRLKFAVEGATDFATASVVAGNNQVFCLTCHQAHGADQMFGLRWTYGTPGAEGSSGCFQCHNQLLSE